MDTGKGGEVGEELDKVLQREYTSRIMPVSPYQKKLIQEKKRRAVELYKPGLPLRAVAREVGMSHTWVMFAVQELSTSPATPPLQD